MSLGHWKGTLAPILGHPLLTAPHGSRPSLVSPALSVLLLSGLGEPVSPALAHMGAVTEARLGKRKKPRVLCPVQRMSVLSSEQQRTGNIQGRAALAAWQPTPQGAVPGAVGRARVTQTPLGTLTVEAGEPPARRREQVELHQWLKSPTTTPGHVLCNRRLGRDCATREAGIRAQAVSV